MKAALEQKRAFRRFDLKGNVNLHPENDRSRMVRAHLDNISLGGAGILSSERMSVHQDVDFNIDTPQLSDALYGSGKVRHVTVIRRYDKEFFYIGIQFERVEKDKVKGLINQTYKLRKKPFLSGKLKRELSLAFKVLPFFMAIIWVLLSTVGKMSVEAAQERESIKNLEQAAVYFLYHHTPYKSQ